jgi:tRNA-specific 2-thiouridylase
MSGGVDSSVAAALLVQKGYRVFGVTMKLWCYADTQARAKPCCSQAAIDDAKSVAAKLCIPHYVIDLEECFESQVIRPFCLGYSRGSTPNPCVMCNTRVKFKALMDKTLSMGADFFATGHYAILERNTHSDETCGSGSRVRSEETGDLERDAREIVRRDDGSHVGAQSKEEDLAPDAQNEETDGSGHSCGWRLRRAADRGKDQSYVLWGIERYRLPRILFPLGPITKKEVRSIASRMGLSSSERLESQDVCFVESGSCGEFVAQRLSRMGVTVSPGPITDVSGARLGTHDGLVYFTIGQRRGLGVSSGRRLYVVALEPESHAVVIGEKRHLLARQFICSDVNWLTNLRDEFPLKALVQIRYTHVPAEAEIGEEDEIGSQPETDEGGSEADASHLKVRVTFEKEQSAITPGQSAVFYRGDEVLGGSTIERVCG